MRSRSLRVASLHLAAAVALVAAAAPLPAVREVAVVDTWRNDPYKGRRGAQRRRGDLSPAQRVVANQQKKNRKP